MNQIELVPEVIKATMPKLWQIFAFILLILITSLIFINNPTIKYGMDFSIAVVNIIAVISAFIIRKKSFFPSGLLVSAIIIINSSFILNSLIFFDIEINTQISLWLEISGIVIIALFCINLLYLLEKQFKLKGVTIDLIIISLSITCLIFLIPPNLIKIVQYQTNAYEKSLIFSVILGSIFLGIVLMAIFLSKAIKIKDILLGTMVISLSVHFYLDAYIIFYDSGNAGIINNFSWVFYQLPAVLAIFYLFTNEYDYNFNPDKAKRLGLKLLWLATILGALIVPLGVIYRWFFDLSNIDPFAIAAMSVTMSIIVIWRVVILISNYEKQRQKLNETAFTDSLTGMSNYLGLQSHIKKMDNLLVLNMDIEDFKSINDMFDRKFGDQVLRSLAKRIASAQGVLYTARTTGDSFIAVFQVEEKDIHEIFSTFQKEIGLWDEVYNRRVAVPLTFGGSHSVEAEDIAVLVRNAEQALKTSREHKRPFTLHKASDELHTPSFKVDLPRHELREILQRSIDRNELPIHFQPIYEIKTGALKALEMLIRVDSIRHGLLVPGQFLEQAKSYGLLTELTHICVNMIAKELHRLPDVIININIPPYMLDDNDTLNDFIKYFESKGLIPKRFCIEVTEDGDIPTDSLIPAIELLKKAGFAIAMDDFGTGYSSLGRLSNLPFDSVKIDRSLLLAADNGDRTILESAINLVKRLGVSVVVEGVETLEQLALVKELGADSVQGFLFSQPVPVINDNQFSLNASDIIAEF